MPTYSQLSKKKRTRKKKINRTPALEKCPQKRGICIKLALRTPKKPNSAIRKLVKVSLYSNSKRVYAHVPGECQNLKLYARVLLRGGRVKDMPGIKYRVIRGKFDCPGLEKRTTSRSKYGTKNLRRYLY